MKPAGRSAESVHALCLLTSGLTLLLLCAGALVTSTGSGLAVPDWPLSYGQLFPDMVGGVLYEHGHRLIAGTVAIVTCLQAIVLRYKEPRAWVRYLGYFALGLVLFQASLGGITVLLRLPKMVSISHAMTAQIFFSTTLILSLVTSKMWRDEGPRALKLPAVSPGIARGCAALTLFFFIQLFLGAFMRHTGAGSAIPDFPKSLGEWVPPFVSQAVVIHYAHRVGAFVIVVSVALLAMWIFVSCTNRLDLIALVGVVTALVTMQIFLGASVIWLKRPVLLTMLHLGVGALALGSSVLLSVRAYRRVEWYEDSGVWVPA